jgi:hypothetical protein
LAPNVRQRIEDKAPSGMTFWQYLLILLFVAVLGVGSFYSTALVQVEQKNHHVSGLKLCDSKNVDHDIHKTNVSSNCAKCPNLGFCLNGILTTCEPPLVRAEVYAVCIPPGEISMKAAQFTRHLYDTLTGQATWIPWMTCTPPSDMKSMEYISEFYHANTNDTSSGKEVIETMVQMIKEKPDDFGIEIKKDKESSFLVVNAIKASPRCRVILGTWAFVYQYIYQIIGVGILLYIVWMVNDISNLLRAEKIKMDLMVTKVKTLVRNASSSTEPELYSAMLTAYPHDGIEDAWEEVMARLSSDSQISVSRINGLVTLDWNEDPIQQMNDRQLF